MSHIGVVNSEKNDTKTRVSAKFVHNFSSERKCKLFIERRHYGRFNYTFLDIHFVVKNIPNEIAYSFEKP